jgi:hypothetical protein
VALTIIRKPVEAPVEAVAEAMVEPAVEHPVEHAVEATPMAAVEEPVAMPWDDQPEAVADASTEAGTLSMVPSDAPAEEVVEGAIAEALDLLMKNGADEGTLVLVRRATGEVFTVIGTQPNRKTNLQANDDRVFEVTLGPREDHFYRPWWR